MKEIQLTQNKTALVDDEDFEMLSKFKWYAYFGNSWYAKTNIKCQSVHMHQLLLPNVIMIDHIDRNGLNNQRENLRVCTHTQNQSNSGPRKGKYKGVSYKKEQNRFVAQIQKHGKKVHIGYFNIETEAALAYDEAARVLFGEFAYLNFKEDNG